jgi:hypothetical protein
MNEDETLDLVLSAGQSDGEVSVLIGNGTGTFQERTVTNVGMQLADIAQGDFDGDDHVDVAVLDRMDNDSGVYVLNGVGDGTFREPVFLPISRFPGTIEAADLDEDGSIDLLASLHSQDFGEVIYFRNDGTGAFPAQERIPVDGNGLRGLEYVDMTGDQVPDLVTLIFLSPAIAVFPASGEGKFDSPILSPTFQSPEGFAFAHLNDDTFLDIATVHRRRPGSQVSLGISLGNGDGTFQESLGSEINASPLRLSIGDVDRDGAADIILPATTSGVLVLFGFGDGTFSNPVFQSTPGTSFNAELALLDDDQNLDLVVNTAASEDAISVLIGNGDGSFQQAREFKVHDNPDDVLVTHLKGDAFPDIVVGHFQAGEVSALLGNGDGTFQQQIFADLNIFGGIGESAEFLRAADVNGDSITDVIFTFVYNSIGVLFGDGSGFLGDFARFDTGNVPLGLIADDVNGDDLPDVVTVNNSGPDLSILIHN